MKAIDDLRDAIRGEPPANAGLPPAAWTFLRGLSVGALAGAVIAGWALVRRRRDRSAGGRSGEGSQTDGAARRR